MIAATVVITQRLLFLGFVDVGWAGLLVVADRFGDAVDDWVRLGAGVALAAGVVDAGG